ncbi:MAG: universal stress protein, partial [Thermoguttaceae bacterium]|nr:universal stress protein [Thermoguttaceae bacterium]
QPVSDLDLLAATITADPEQLTPDQVTMKEKLHGTSDARLQSIESELDRSGRKSYKLRGTAGSPQHRDLRKRIREQGADWVVIEEPPAKAGEGTAGILVNIKSEDSGQQNLQVTIPLRSVGSSSESG